MIASRESCARASATCASATSSAAAFWSTALWLTKFCASRLAAALQVGARDARLRLRLLQLRVAAACRRAAPATGRFRTRSPSVKPSRAMRPLTSGRTITVCTARRVPTAWASSSMRSTLDLADFDRGRATPPAGPAPPAPLRRRRRTAAAPACASAAHGAPRAGTTTPLLPARRCRPPPPGVQLLHCHAAQCSLVPASVAIGSATAAVNLLGGAAVGQRIGALVAGVAGMALDPAPIDRVLRGQRIQALPEVDVLHRLLVGRLPAALLPVVDPRRDALAHVLAVGVKLHAAVALERGQRFDHGGEFHAVVGGERFAAPEFLLVRAGFSQAPQPPGPGLPLQAPSV